MKTFRPSHQTILLEEETYLETLRSIRQQLLPYRLTGSFASFDGTELRWEGYLAENARGTVVILHGFTEFPGKYLEMTWYFLNRGYHVFLPTQRGHDTAGIIHVNRFDDYVYDLNCFIEQFRSYTDSLPLYLYAHSMGGGVGARHLQEYPGEFQKAILSSPMFCPRAADLPYAAALCGTRAMLCRGGQETSTLFTCTFDPDMPLERSSAASEGRFRWNISCRLENPLYQTSGVSNRWVYESVALQQRVLRRSNCRRIRVPVLVFSAGRDAQVRLAPQERFVKRVPSAVLVRYPEEKHELFSAKNEVLKDYLDRIFAFLETEPAGQ